MGVTLNNMCDTAFDEALRMRFAEARKTFCALHRYGHSDETQESLLHKAEIVKARMAEGASFSEACDSPQVYLNYLDREYLSHVVYCVKSKRDHIPLDTWRLNHLIADASADIRSASHD